jgi:hypothetical protein
LPHGFWLVTFTKKEAVFRQPLLPAATFAATARLTDALRGVILSLPTKYINMAIQHPSFTGAE